MTDITSFMDTNWPILTTASYKWTSPIGQGCVRNFLKEKDQMDWRKKIIIEMMWKTFALKFVVDLTHILSIFGVFDQFLELAWWTDWTTDKASYREGYHVHIWDTPLHFGKYMPFVSFLSTYDAIFADSLGREAWTHLKMVKWWATSYCYCLWEKSKYEKVSVT